MKIVPGKFSTGLDVITRVARFLKRSADTFEVEENITQVIQKKVERYVLFAIVDEI